MINVWIIFIINQKDINIVFYVWIGVNSVASLTLVKTSVVGYHPFDERSHQSLVHELPTKILLPSSEISNSAM